MNSNNTTDAGARREYPCRSSTISATCVHKIFQRAFRDPNYVSTRVPHPETLLTMDLSRVSCQVYIRWVVVKNKRHECRYHFDWLSKQDSCIVIFGLAAFDILFVGAQSPCRIDAIWSIYVTTELALLLARNYANLCSVATVRGLIYHMRIRENRTGARKETRGSATPPICKSSAQKGNRIPRIRCCIYDTLAIVWGKDTLGCCVNVPRAVKNPDATQPPPDAV